MITFTEENIDWITKLLEQAVSKATNDENKKNK